jgi:hypothetical protein
MQANRRGIQPMSHSQRIASNSLLGVLVLALAVSTARTAEPTFTAEQLAFYNKQVMPILKEHCYKCHAGDKMRGGLRLDSRAALLKGGDLGPAVLLDKHDQSPFLKAINYRDGLEMPPSGKLPADKIAVLTRWVTMGLPFPAAKEPIVKAPEHGPLKITQEDRNWWAYRPLQRVEPPAVSDAGWASNPVDHFILHKLEKAGLQPAGRADRLTLLRRLSYDLTGLPPTPEQIDEFLADRRPDAYERLVDRLLASPAYGEKWGRHWLDLVRFAETHGYERDSVKPFAWRYRDYVIDSFNADKSYRQFIREQLAGDELEQVTPETLIATGYYRLGVWDDEPVDRLQLRYDVLDGVVATTGQVVLGMSIGCARCHDHKKDPITQRDYYRFLGFFHDITDMNGRNTRLLRTPEQERQQAELLRQLEQKEKERAKEVAELEKRFVQQARKRGLISDGAIGVEAGGILVADSRRAGTEWLYTTDKPANDWMQPGFEDMHWKRGPGGFGTAGTPGAIVRTTWNSKDIWLRKRFEVDSVPTGLALDLHHDEDVEVYLNGKLIHRARGYLTDYTVVPLGPEVRQLIGKGRNVLAVHCRQTVGGQYIDVGLRSDRATSVSALLKQYGTAVLGEQAMKRYAELTTKPRRREKPPEIGLEIMCVEESGTRPNRVLIRGNPHAPGEEVTPGVPEVLSGNGAKLAIRPVRGSSGKRLALADWLTAPDNALTARVLANRLWQYHFGRGLSPTPSDLGKLGEPATHPELLDWLAAQLVAGDYRLKPLHRLLLTSSTYQMSSQANSQALAKDPANNLFWRFNMRRLTAEEVRDSILAVSGDLNRRMAGPGVYPTIPAAVLAGQSVPGAGWGKSPPEEQARRSVYVHVKRSLIVPILESHDLADTDSSCAVRYTTTVPTQALGMLNGDFTNEQASRLAARLQAEAPGDIEGQIRRAIRLISGRQPSPAEVQQDLALLERLRHGTAGKQRDAASALRLYCLMALNTNEFLYLD